MNQENEEQREVLKMPISLRIVRILMIINAVLIGEFLHGPADYLVRICKQLLINRCLFLKIIILK